MNIETDPKPSAYDQVLYPSHTRIQTHPDRMATIATLFGMQPAPVEKCRMLEMGCGNGSNLGPIAFSLPGSEFVGIDAAVKPIAQAQEMVQTLGMANTTFRHCDILDIGEDFGRFDYIVAHGVYSWVPETVRDKMLEVCRRHLAPQGVAFISYNAYPGNHVYRMVREMMLYHIRDIDKPEDKVAQSKALAKFLAEARDNPNLYQQFLLEELERFVNVSANYIIHDALAEINSPSYFHEFMAHAAQHRLQYLGEADFHEMLDKMFKPETSKALAQLSRSRIEREQYMDFVKCRRFRQTLLCHESVSLDLALKAELAPKFYVSSIARAASPAPDLDGTTVEMFEGRKGATIRTSSPVAKTAFQLLGDLWPQPLQFSELVARARAQIKARTGRETGTPVEDALELGKTMLQSYASGLAELHVHLPCYSPKVSERPVANPFARWQVQHGDFVTSLYHNSMAVEDALGRQMLLLLDGTRDRAALVEELLAFVKTQPAIKGPDGQPLGEVAQARVFLAAELEKNLVKLARMGLLTA